MAEESVISEKKILVCDDEKAVSSFLERFLKKEGYTRIDTVATGQEALDRIAKEQYHLVLLDIRLPDMDGIQTLQRIRAVNDKLAVIMITGFPEIETAQEAVKMGAYDYIVKPFDLAYLKLVVLTKILLDSK